MRPGPWSRSTSNLRLRHARKVQNCSIWREATPSSGSLTYRRRQKKDEAAATPGVLLAASLKRRILHALANEKYVKKKEEAKKKHAPGEIYEEAGFQNEFRVAWYIQESPRLAVWPRPRYRTKHAPEMGYGKRSGTQVWDSHKQMADRTCPRQVGAPIMGRRSK